MVVRIQKGALSAKNVGRSATSSSAVGRTPPMARTAQPVKKVADGPPIALWITLGVFGVLGVIALICGLYSSYNKNSRCPMAVSQPVVRQPVKKTYQPTPIAELGGMTLKEYQEKYGDSKALEERKKRVGDFANPK